MFGNVYEIKYHLKSGFITGDDGNTYYYNSADLKNCTRFQLEEGDQIEFDVIPRAEGSRFDRAVRIRKTAVSGDRTKINTVNPGINPNCRLEFFNSDERMIISKLAEAFYVTNAGAPIYINTSEYRYCLIKPTEYFTTMFHLNRELVVVFSDYIEFEPRSLDAMSEVLKRIESKLRVERCCHVMISNDTNIAKNIAELLKDTNLNSIVIPFSYYEFKKGKVSVNVIQNRFKKYLFDVDLFSESRPIEDDIFFFGRRDYVHDIANKCKRNSHCGVFGLRRSGKTSLLYAVKRLLENEGYNAVYIPCNKDLAKVDWKTGLYIIVKDINNVLGGSKKLHSSSKYEEQNKVSMFFEEDMNLLLEGLAKPVTLMFDEIEYITFNSVIAEDSWKNGKEYIDFWNVIRGYWLKYPNRLSIVIAGTNPMINEVPSIQVGKDHYTNPMFQQLSQSNKGAYLPPFDIQSTTKMINTLGGYMGITFNESVCAKITSDCGGHPYLERLLCKKINQYIQEKNLTRPVSITQALYEEIRPEFEKSSDAQGFYAMILLILQDSYSKEYNVLKILATKNDRYIEQTQDETSLIHLLGYGIIDYNNGKYAITFETVKRFLEGKYKYEIEGLSAEEKNAEISMRYNNVESILRRIVRQNLHMSMGITRAKEVVLQAMSFNLAAKKYVERAQELDYIELFDPSVNSGMYFSVLKTIIYYNYDYFGNIFENEDKEDVNYHLKIINDSRKAPAHTYENTSVNWTDDEFRKFRKSMAWLEKKLKPFND